MFLFLMACITGNSITLYVRLFQCCHLNRA